MFAGSWHLRFPQDADEHKRCGLTDPHQPPSSCEEKIHISSAGFNHLLPLNNKLGGGEEMDLFMPLTVQKKKNVYCAKTTWALEQWGKKVKTLRGEGAALCTQGFWLPQGHT